MPASERNEAAVKDFYGTTPGAFVAQLQDATVDEFTMACSELAKATKSSSEVTAVIQREGLKSLKSNFARLGDFCAQMVFETPPAAPLAVPSAQQQAELDRDVSALVEKAAQLRAQLKALSDAEQAFVTARQGLDDALGVKPVLEQVDFDSLGAVMRNVKRLHVLQETAVELKQSSAPARTENDSEDRFTNELLGMPSARVLDQVALTIGKS